MTGEAFALLESVIKKTENVEEGKMNWAVVWGMKVDALRLRNTWERCRPQGKEGFAKQRLLSHTVETITKLEMEKTCTPNLEADFIRHFFSDGRKNFQSNKAPP
jgi:hypothetical protein